MYERSHDEQDMVRQLEALKVMIYYHIWTYDPRIDSPVVALKAAAFDLHRSSQQAASIPQATGRVGGARVAAAAADSLLMGVRLIDTKGSRWYCRCYY